MFPLLVIFFVRKRTRVVLLTAAALSIAWEVLALTWPVHGLQFDKQLPARLIQFVLGMSCAIVVQRGIVIPRKQIIAVLVTAGFLAAVMSTYSVTIARLSMWGLCFAALALLLARVEPKRCLRPLAFFGVFSYSFYLLHQPFLLITAQLPPHVTKNPYAILLLGCTFGLGAISVISYVFYRVVELPSHQFGRRIAPSQPIH